MSVKINRFARAVIVTALAGGLAVYWAEFVRIWWEENKLKDIEMSFDAAGIGFIALVAVFAGAAVGAFFLAKNDHNLSSTLVASAAGASMVGVFVLLVTRVGWQGTWNITRMVVFPVLWMLLIAFVAVLPDKQPTTTPATTATPTPATPTPATPTPANTTPAPAVGP